MPAYHWFVALHIVFGTLALAAFWLAACMKKGRPRHRAIGKAFLLAMCGVIISGVPLAIEQLLFRKSLVGGMFLSYLLPLTGSACWMAWRAVTDKRDWRRMTARIGWHLALWLPLLFALPVLALGVMKSQMLLIGFSTIAFITAWRMRRFARNGPTLPNWHIVQHYQAMLGAGVATHVAFLAIGMRPVWRWLRANINVPDAVIELFPWFAPLAVAIAAALWLDRKYAKAAARKSAR